MSIPTVYNLDWEPKRPKFAPSVVHIFVPPVVGANVMIPESDGYMRTYLVLSVTPRAHPVGLPSKMDGCAADLVLQVKKE